MSISRGFPGTRITLTESASGGKPWLPEKNQMPILNPRFCEFRMGKLAHASHNQIARPGQVDPAYLDETRSFHPLHVFRLAVTSASIGGDKHVSCELYRLLGRLSRD